MSHRFYRILQAFHDEAVMTMLHKYGNRAAAIGDNRRAAGHRLNHHQPERLRPVDRKQQRIRIAQELIFLPFADLANELHERIAEQWGDDQIEIILIYAIDFRRNLKGHAHLLGTLDSAVYPFLW